MGRARRRLPTALLLPGIDGSGRMFAPLLAAEPRGFVPEVVSYPAEPLGYDALSARVRARLPSGPFLLLAESFSGPIAVRLAAARPPGLVAVVLAATFLHRPLHPLLLPLRGLLTPRLAGLALPAPIVRHLLAGPDAPHALVAALQAAVAAVPREVMAARVAEALRVDVREEFARVEAPTLWLAPGRDRLLRDGAEEALALKPELEVARLDAPHLLLQRCPHACLAEVEELLARAGRAARPPAAGG